jgi:O-antigen ligase
MRGSFPANLVGPLYNLGMRTIDFEKKLSWLLAIGGCLTSVIVLAWNTSEPVNAPKLLVLGATGFAALFFLIRNARLVSWASLNKVTYLVLFLFILFSLISTLASESSFTTGFFGVVGRNTGFITYACLAVILAAATQLRSNSVIERVLTGLFYAGVVNLVYFVFTLFGVELIPWNNVYNRVLGTFGNPNFVGAFMGFFVILCFARVFDSTRNIKARVAIATLIPLTLLEIKRSLASQGVVITGLGLALLGFFFVIWKVKSRIVKFSYIAIVTVAGLLAVAGALQMGPLASVIYKSSVSFRGEYWAAGWNMGLNNPIFGVGLDSYGFWYREFRNPSALVSPGKDVTTNTAHNVFIDIFASGGFPLFVLYIALTLLVVVKIIHVMKVNKNYDPTFVAVSTLWACYQAQSIVSINQIGIAIWGWILAGLVLGYKAEVDSSELGSQGVSNSGKNKGRSLSDKEVKTSVISLILGGVIGGMIVSPPYSADVRWRAILNQPNAINLEEGAKAWPLNLDRIVQASQIYSKNNVIDKGLELAKFGTEKFPNDFRAWYFYYLQPNIPASEKQEVKQILQKLDPNNADFR